MGLAKTVNFDICFLAEGNPTIDTQASILKIMRFKLTLTPIEKAS